MGHHTRKSSHILNETIVLYIHAWISYSQQQSNIYSIYRIVLMHNLVSVWMSFDRAKTRLIEPPSSRVYILHYSVNIRISRRKRGARKDVSLGSRAEETGDKLRRDNLTQRLRSNNIRRRLSISTNTSAPKDGMSLPAVAVYTNWMDKFRLAGAENQLSLSLCYCCVNSMHSRRFL